MFTARYVLDLYYIIEVSLNLEMDNKEDSFE